MRTKRNRSILLILALAACAVIAFLVWRSPTIPADSRSEHDTSPAPAGMPSRERKADVGEASQADVEKTGDAGPSAPDTLVLADGVVLGSDAVAAAGAVVTATLLASDGVALAETRTDAAGAFRLAAPANAFRAGPLDFALVARCDDLVSLPQVTVGGPGIAASSVVLRLRAAATLLGRVVDDGGAPVGAASVFVMAFPDAREPWENSATDGMRLHLRADEAGRFRLQVPPSHVRVFVRDAAGVFSRGLRCDVAGGESTDLGDVEIGGAGVALTLRVTGQDGSPVAGASIRMDVDEAVQRHIDGGGTQWVPATTDGEGVAIVRVRADSSPVRFAVGDRAHEVVEVVAERLPGSDRTLDIALVERPKVIVRVVDGEDRPLPREVEPYVTLSAESGAPPRAARRLAFGVPADAEVTRLSQVSEADALERAVVGLGVERSADGAAIVALAQGLGRHRLLVRVPGGHAFSRDVDLTDEQRAAEVTCRLPPGRFVSIDFVRHGPEPVEYADWSVWPSVAGALDAQWPSRPDEWSESRAQGAKIELAESSRGEWTGHVVVFAALEQSEFVARDVAAAMRENRWNRNGPHSTQGGVRRAVEPLLRRTIASGASPRVTFDLGTIAPGEPTTPLAVRLVAGQHPVRVRGWRVDLRRGEDSAVRHGATGDDGVARFAVPAGRWRVELSSDFGPPDPLWIDVVAGTPARVDLDLSKLRWD